MNSKALSETLALAPRIRGPRSLLLLAVAYDALLVAAGAALIARGSEGISAALTFAVFPAVIYTIGIFRYQRALFTDAGPTQRAQAWWRLVRLATLLFAGTLTVYSL
jgi:hypothetical protein